MRVFEHRVLEYRRTFRASIFGSFVSPALFLTAMGIGLGGYVNGASSQSFEGGAYLRSWRRLARRVADADRVGEAMFPILGGLQWQPDYHAMYATPIRPRDIASGILLWIDVG